MSAEYDTDFYAWSMDQANLLRSGRYSMLDIQHLAEEIEDLGKRERRALKSRLGVLLGHMLKWQVQPDYPNRKSWRATINTQRRALAELLEENPSLKAQLPTLLAKAYADGVDLAISETPFDSGAFPQQCPWALHEVLGDYWPEAIAR